MKLYYDLFFLSQPGWNPRHRKNPKRNPSYQKNWINPNSPTHCTPPPSSLELLMEKISGIIRNMNCWNVLPDPPPKRAANPPYLKSKWYLEVDTKATLLLTASHEESQKGKERTGLIPWILLRWMLRWMLWFPYSATSWVVLVGTGGGQGEEGERGFLIFLYR